MLISHQNIHFFLVCISRDHLKFQLCHLIIWTIKKSLIVQALVKMRINNKYIIYYGK